MKAKDDGEFCGTDAFATTENHLLGSALRLRQPARGDRVAIDAVFLAAAVDAKNGERALDVGAGSGAASLCLAKRAPGVSIVALEKQPQLARVARENAEINGLAGRMSVREGDIAAWASSDGEAAFDHVMTNPPFHEKGGVTASSDPRRRAAHIEGDLGLADWIAACLRRVKPKGALTLIHRADRLDAVLAALAGKAGGVAVFPLWPRAGENASRVIVRARKATRTPARLLPGLVLHSADGRYTDAAEAVLRQGKGLEL